MKTIYTVYQLNEKVNKLGNPYIGFTENLIVRAKTWKHKLKLDYIPELISLYTDTSAQRAFNWEQDKRVENGWTRERPLRHLRTITKKAHKSVKEKKSWKTANDINSKNNNEGYKKAAMAAGLKNAKNKTGVCDPKNRIKANLAMKEKYSKLNEEQKLQILKEYVPNSKHYSMHQLAKKYSVSATVIFRLIKQRLHLQTHPI